MSEDAGGGRRPLSAGGSRYPWVNRTQVADPARPVAPVVEAAIRGLGYQITDEQIERDKAGHRGLFLTELKGILSRCDAGDPDDPRWDELRLRALDRLAKLARIYELDAPKQRHGPGNPRDLANAAAAALVELEGSLAEARVPA